jgi:hypothetical protein
MRILHELQMGTKVMQVAGGVNRMVAIGMPPIQAAITLDAVSSWLWASPKQEWSLNDDFGPLLPPFERMWMEWEYPLPELVNGASTRTPFPAGSRGASWVESIDNHNLAIRDFVKVRGWGILPSPWATYVKLDDEGRNVDVSMGFEHAEDAEKFADRTHAVMPLEALFGISLMNCRNVTIDDERADKQTASRARRGGEIPYALKQINVPGLNRSATRMQARNAAGAAIPLHLVRGHFKTFTEEAPLFGSKVGTFWWGWQTRGKKEHGVRDHEYVVRPSS